MLPFSRFLIWCSEPCFGRARPAPRCGLGPRWGRSAAEHLRHGRRHGRALRRDCAPPCSAKAFRARQRQPIRATAVAAEGPSEHLVVDEKRKIAGRFVKNFPVNRGGFLPVARSQDRVQKERGVCCAAGQQPHSDLGWNEYQGNGDQIIAAVKTKLREPRRRDSR